MHEPLHPSPQPLPMMFWNQNMPALFLYALLFTTIFAFLANGYQFHVGGKYGWTVNPHESYNHWASRNRFQVNDTLYFKYDDNRDSVLVVDQDDYNSCNITTPQLKLQGGNSVFKFDRSGPFFFITSNVTNCQKGQKLVVVVLAVRSPGSITISPVSAPSPSQHLPPGKSAGVVVVVRPLSFLVLAVCVLLGLSM